MTGLGELWVVWNVKAEGSVKEGRKRCHLRARNDTGSEDTASKLPEYTVISNGV